MGNKRQEIIVTEKWLKALGDCGDATKCLSIWERLDKPLTLGTLECLRIHGSVPVQDGWITAICRFFAGMGMRYTELTGVLNSMEWHDGYCMTRAVHKPNNLWRWLCLPDNWGMLVRHAAEYQPEKEPELCKVNLNNLEFEETPEGIAVAYMGKPRERKYVCLISDGCTINTGPVIGVTRLGARGFDSGHLVDRRRQAKMNIHDDGTVRTYRNGKEQK